MSPFSTRIASQRRISFAWFLNCSPQRSSSPVHLFIISSIVLFFIPWRTSPLTSLTALAPNNQHHKTPEIPLSTRNPLDFSSAFFPSIDASFFAVNPISPPFFSAPLSRPPGPLVSFSPPNPNPFLSPSLSPGTGVPVGVTPVNAAKSFLIGAGVVLVESPETEVAAVGMEGIEGVEIAFIVPPR